MPAPWISYLELIKNGEPVDASTDNRVLQQLGQRTDYLKTIIDAVSGANGIFDISAPVAPEVLEGQPVYWNAERLRYEQALAAVDSTDSGLYGNLADSAYCLGICVGKTGPVRGSVLYSGRVDGIDFTAAVEGGVITPGPYFLSSVEAGKMVKDRPPMSIFVMFGLTAGSVHVNPNIREVLEAHIHYALPLEYGNIVGDPGWTVSFDPGLAPAGAIYRYTVESDQKVNDVFPFLPADAAYFDVDGIGSDDKVIIDMNGIWWVDSVNQPSDYNRMTIYYAKMTAKTNTTMVTSLRPFSEGPLSFVDCYGKEAYAGDLYAKLSLLLEQGGNDTAGWLAFKELTASQQFLRGPIVENIRSASQEITVSVETVGGDPQGVVDGDGRKAGRLILTFNNPNDLSRELTPTLVSLTNATQEDYNGLVPYVGLPMGMNSAVSYRFDIPAEIPGQYKLYFESWLFASVGGVFPSLTCNYIVVKAASETVLHNMSENTSGSAALSVPITSVSANDYVLASLLPGTGITVNPGEQVHIIVNRPSGTSYAGAVGIMRVLGILEKVV